MKKRWGAFAFTMALIIISIFLLFMVWLAPIILLLWVVSAGLAVWDLRKKVIKQT